MLIVLSISDTNVRLTGSLRLCYDKSLAFSRIDNRKVGNVSSWGNVEKGLDNRAYKPCWLVTYQVCRVSPCGRDMIRWKLVVGILGLLAVSLQANAQSALSHTSGNVAVAVTDFGSLGAVRESAIAPNFRFPKSDGRYYLYERSEIWVGDRNGNVANTWEWDAKEEQWLLDEWRPTTEGRIAGHVERDGRQIITAQYAPSGATDFPLDLLVNQTSFSWRGSEAPGTEEFVIIRLTVVNEGDSDHDGIYVALMADWDVDAPVDELDEPSLDRVEWDEDHRTLFAYDADESDGINSVHAGLALLDGELSTHRIVPFDVGNFTDAAKSRFMSDQSLNQETGEALPPQDYVSVLVAGPYNLEARGSFSVTFALLVGEALAALQENINVAKRMSYTPQRLAAETIGESIELAWERPINSSVGGYIVFRRHADTNQFERLTENPFDLPNFTDTQIAFGSQYAYFVRPVGSDGHPLPFDSREVSITPSLAPTPPDDVTAILEENKVLVSWKKSSEPAIVGYLIYRNHTGREPWTQIKVVSSDSANYVDLDVYPGLSYFYSITAMNSSGKQSEFSMAANVVVPGDPLDQLRSDLENVIVVPNPYRIEANRNPIEFRNLTRHATIRIFSSVGDLIKTIEHHSETPTKTWDGRTTDGSLLADGVYIYHVESPRETGRGLTTVSGKFAVIR